MKLEKNRIRELRIEMNIPSKELAKLIDVTPGAITHYEKGDREAPYSVLINLSRIFDCSLDYLLGVSDERKSINNALDSIDKSKDIVDVKSLTDDQKEAINNLIKVFEKENKKDN